MSHPMTEWIAENFLPKRLQFRLTLTAQCKENEFIPLMKQAPKGLEVSSLPKIKENRYEATLSIEGEDKVQVQTYFVECCNYLKKKRIYYKLGEHL